jgi:hypothetical protein
MPLSYSEIQEKIKKYNTLKKRYLDLKKNTYEKHFKQQFDEINKILESKDLRTLDQLQEKIDDVEEKITHQKVINESKKLEETLHQITQLTPLIETSYFKSQLEKIKNNNSIEELNKITKKIYESFDLAQKYNQYQNKILPFKSKDEDIYKILTNELVKLSKEKQKNFKQIDILITQYKEIRKEYKYLRNKIKDISQKTDFKDQKFLEELSKIYNQSVQTNQITEFANIKNQILFIENNQNQIHNALNQIRELQKFFKKEEQIQELLNKQNNFLSNWRKETFESIHNNIEQLEKKKKKYLEHCTEIHNSICQLKKDTNLPFQQQLKNIKQLRTDYNPTLLQLIKNYLQHKQEYVYKKQKMLEIKQQLMEKKKKLIDKTIEGTISNQAISFAMENINKRLEKNNKEIKKLAQLIRKQK